MEDPRKIDDRGIFLVFPKRPERLAYLRRMQYLYINGFSLLILAGIFFLINSVSVGISLVVIGVFLVAGISLLVKGVFLHISVSLSTYAVIALISLIRGNLALYIYDRMIWRGK